MENFDDGKIHHKTIAVRFNNIKTPEEGAEKMDIEINNFLDDLQKNIRRKE